ncbi:hypothetical protein BC835DRAFT_1312375 [Cytidiella melzeri]|nr:hypothetical protein BC835DRAFT_1312375 [Cytidiella melzeri]
MFWSRIAYGHLTRRLPIPTCLTRGPARRLASYFDPNTPRDTRSRVLHRKRIHAALPVDFDGLVSQLRDALREKGPAHVRETFLRLFEDPASFAVSDSTASTTAVDDRQVIVSAMRKLAMADDVKFLNRILAAFEKWGIEVDPVMHGAILQGFQGRDLIDSALWWLQNLSTRATACRPRIEWWNTHLAECMRLQRGELFWKSVHALRQYGVSRPNRETYRLIFKHLLAEHSPAIPRHVSQTWINHMAVDGVPFTRSLYRSLVEEFTQAGAFQGIVALQRMHLLAPHAEGKDLLCAQRLAATIRYAGDTSARRLFLQFREHGFVPTPATLDVIADVLSSVTALHRWEEWLGVQASPTAWENFMTRLLTNGQWRHVGSTYREAIKQGRRPTPGMLLPVLHAHCSKPSKPTETDIANALGTFRDYLRLTSDGEGHVGRTTPQAQDDLPLYNILLRTLIHSQSPSLHKTAVSLLEELHFRGIVMDHMATASYIILLMKLSANVHEAFKVYQMLYKRADGEYALDQKGYVAVLNAYCNLGPSASPALVIPYMTMLKDMRTASYDVPADIYTILLRQLSLSAEKVQSQAEELLDQLVEHIKRVHHSLSLDPTLTPDIALWNQLMDTYQRARCFNEAFTIWETMVATGRFDNITVSIVLDACSFSGYFDKGRNIMRRLHRSGFRLNEHNWSTWVECLCRHKKFEEAMRVLCVDLPEKGGIPPSADIAKLILRFARGLREERGLHERIKRELPELYASLER